MSLIHHVLLWEAKLKILARKCKALNIGGVASEAYIWCCQWHPFKYSKQRSHTRQSLSRMTHRRKRIFSSLKKCKKVDRVITTQPTLTTNIFFRLILYMIKPKLMSFRVITWLPSNILEHQGLQQNLHRYACDNNPNPRGLLANQDANHYWQDCQ